MASSSRAPCLRFLMIGVLVVGLAPEARAGFTIDATIPEAVYDAVTGNPTIGWARTQRFSADGSRLIGAFEVGTSGSDDEAFVWSESEGVVLLGDFPGGRYDATPTGISADGTIVVGRSWGATSNDPFVWDDVNGMQHLGTLPAGYNRARPTAVSDDGGTVVGYLLETTGPPEAFHWDAANGYTPLGTLPGGTQSEALAVSGDGSAVAGWGPIGGGDYEAFHWTAAGGLVALGDFTGSNHWSQGLALSDDGSIVVGYGWKRETCGGQCSTNTERAFRWTAAGGLEEIGSWLEPTNVPISASSDASVVIGTAPGSGHFVWREGLGAEDLEALFELESGTDVDDWEIEPLQVVDDGGRVRGARSRPLPRGSPGRLAPASRASARVQRRPGQRRRRTRRLPRRSRLCARDRRERGARVRRRARQRRRRWNRLGRWSGRRRAGPELRRRLAGPRSPARLRTRLRGRAAPRRLGRHGPQAQTPAARIGPSFAGPTRRASSPGGEQACGEAPKMEASPPGGTLSPRAPVAQLDMSLRELGSTGLLNSGRIGLVLGMPRCSGSFAASWRISSPSRRHTDLEQLLSRAARLPSEEWPASAGLPL